MACFSLPFPSPYFSFLLNIFSVFLLIFALFFLFLSLFFLFSLFSFLFFLSSHFLVFPFLLFLFSFPPPPIPYISLLCLASFLTKGQPLPRQWGGFFYVVVVFFIFPCCFVPPDALPGDHGVPTEGCGSGCPGTAGETQSPEEDTRLSFSWSRAKELTH